MELNFWDDFLVQIYDIFAMLWDTGHDLWRFFTQTISETYLELNGGVVDEITESILRAIGQYKPIEFMVGGAIAIVLVRFIFKLFVPFS